MIENIMRESREISDYEMRIAYVIISAANEWQKETGKSLDDLLAELREARA